MGTIIHWSEACFNQSCVSHYTFHACVLQNQIYFTYTQWTFEDLILLTCPSTEEEITSVHAASEADVDKAVQAARAAFEGEAWQSIVGTAWGKLMLKIADLVKSQQHVLATIKALDNSKPYSQALGNIEQVLSVFRYYGGWADKTYSQTIETSRAKFTYTVREPIGVCV